MVAAPAFAHRDGESAGPRELPAFVHGSMWVKLDQSRPEIRVAHVLVVGAIEEDETIWIEGTNTGSNFGDVVVDLMAPGRSIRVFDNNMFLPAGFPNSDFVTGTSFAAPMVAAAAALFWSQNLTATAEDVALAVKATVRQEAWLTGTCETSGILDVAN